MITEKKLLKISGKYALIGLAISLFFWFIIYDCGICHAQTQTGYRIPARVDIGGGRMTGDFWMQAGTSGVRLIIGTQAVTQVGTVGVINGTNAESSPMVRFPTSGGSTSVNFTGFNAVYIGGSQVGTSGALSGKLDATGGIGTNNTFNNPTIAGQGTVTATNNYNGLNISPTEVSYLDGMTENINSKFTTVTGSITNHAHSGSDGTIKISHTDLTPASKGTQTHTQIDTFIDSKAVASGLASLDSNSLVVQNPASASKTPGTSTIVMTGSNTDRLADAFLSDNITKLGTPTTDNISEGSTNKYYTDGRVNSAVGSTSVNLHSDVNIVFNEGDFVKISGGQLIAGSSTASVAFSEVTGSATASQLPLISGLLGSATAVQLPSVISFSGTTTVISGTSSNGRLYNLVTTENSTTFPTSTLFVLKHNNPGTTTFTDSSSYARVITANGNAIGTTTAKFGSGGGSFDGNGDYLSMPYDSRYHIGTGSMTLTTQAYFIGTVAPQTFFNMDNTKHIAFSYQGGGTGLRFYDADAGINVSSGTWSPSTLTWYQVKLCKNNSSYLFFVDGALLGAGTSATAITSTGTGTFWIGTLPGDTTQGVNGVLDDTYFMNIAENTGAFTPPTAEVASSVNLTVDSLQYIPPGTTTSFITVRHNTDTTNYIGVYIGTRTPFGTSNAFAVQILQNMGGYLGDRFGQYCFGAIKSIKEEGATVQAQCYADVMQVEIVKQSPRIRSISDVEVAENAKEEYLQEGSLLWREANLDKYIEIGSETTMINEKKLNNDFKNLRLSEWNVGLPDKNERIKKKRYAMEADTNELNTSIITDHPDTPESFKTKNDPLIWNMGNTMGNLVGAFQELDKKSREEIGSLSVSLENQKIAYNEEVDNLYQLINAIIVALVAIGGVSGWTNIRRKRKGT